MQVGLSVIFQNPDETVPDQQVYQQDLSLALQAEGLGFDSVWSVEHHFTDYTMCPDVLQFLTYMAGATKKIKLGSMVCVLPWHDPLRVAEQISMLDNLSDGRFILGLGRGTGKVEFDGFRTEMDTARLRFKESTEMVLNALENGYAEYHGELIEQPRVDIRPRPLKSMRGRAYAAAVSPESAKIMAELGVGILIVPQKPWKAVRQELQDYRDVYREANDAEPPSPLVAGWTFVDENPNRAEEKAREYIGGYWDSIIKHYEFDKPHLKDTEGYEAHGVMYDRLKAPGGMEMMTDFFVNLQIWGSPQQVFDKIMKLQDETHMDGYMGVFSFAGMPISEADTSMKLFAREVMPELQKLAPVQERLGIPA
ncbi:MAG: LLM class flavin-dependent oxidoreductase [Acidimicrobiales bacterium]|jgi:alkanesulfonate monooxygenase SsuD/methylene tetrahydromethanopterin reductase-like flavin-dependent oxidoreductase (luciferase family)|nr:LLM class flavin-dependent oxidoreductase [Acidimicrobiales bacterium]